MSQLTNLSRMSKIKIQLNSELFPMSFYIFVVVEDDDQVHDDACRHSKSIQIRKNSETY